MLRRLMTYQDFLERQNPQFKTNEDFINNYIDEAMSVSFEVSQMVEYISTQIKKEINKKDNIVNLEPLDINGHKCQLFKFKKNPGILIFGNDCELDLKFINIADELDSEELKAISRNYTTTKTKRKKPDYTGDLKKYIDIAYTLEGTVVLYNNDFCLYSKTALSHELRHCYIYLKSRSEKTVGDELNKELKNKSWNQIYDYCDDYMKKCKDGHFKYGEEFYKIIYALYTCDIEELDAFVQQAYDNTKLSRCKTKEEIKSNLKDTDLWVMIQNLKDAMDILNKDGFKEKFNSLRTFRENEILPSASEIYSLLRKVYEEAYSRFGKILMTLIDELEEDSINESNNINWFYILNRNKNCKDYKL